MSDNSILYERFGPFLTKKKYFFGAKMDILGFLKEIKDFM
jgi:hypothetical protein